jgi:citrate synthase
MNGLDGIVVAETRLSEIDGAAGRLLVAGHPLEAARMRFEAVCALLWESAEPELGSARAAAFARLDDLGGALAMPHAIDALRAGMAQLSTRDEPSFLRQASAVTGAMAVLAAAWVRRAAGEPPVAPDPELPQAVDTLRMMQGKTPAPEAACALSTYLCSVSEHGMNASTFVARAVASTGAELVSAVVAGLSALEGPLHGGAPGPVLDMIDAIGIPERAEEWIERELAAGRRIMGMGHRVYRTRDPRAAVLEGALRDSGASNGERAALARVVEATAARLLAERHPDRPLEANVEFHTALLLEALGIPRGAFTAVFAVGRVAGWCAHVDEQRRSGRLIRPSSRYVGARPAA